MNPKITPKKYPFQPFGLRNNGDSFFEKNEGGFSKKFDLNRNLNLCKNCGFLLLRRLMKAIIAPLKKMTEIILNMKKSRMLLARIAQRKAMKL